MVLGHMSDVVCNLERRNVTALAKPYYAPLQYPAKEDGERSKNGVWIEENIAHFHAASGWWRHNDRS